jgi:hypothetical protein
MTNTQRYLTLWRAWIWAAMHSPLFPKCQFQLNNSPIWVEFHYSKYIRKTFVIRLVLTIPEVTFDIPFIVFNSFVQAMKQQGEEISYDVLDNIPF